MHFPMFLTKCASGTELKQSSFFFLSIFTAYSHVFLLFRRHNFEELFHCWIVKSFASETTIIYLSSGSNVELFMRRTKCK